jgi:hypothetical protein
MNLPIFMLNIDFSRQWRMSKARKYGLRVIDDSVSPRTRLLSPHHNPISGILKTPSTDIALFIFFERKDLFEVLYKSRTLPPELH